MHEVRFTSGFYLGATPVTQAQYMALMGGENPSHFKEDPSLPVENLDWHQAVAFCDALSKRLGHKVRLPRESEWEYACRADKRTRFWSGDSEEALAKVGWYDKNSESKTHPVGQRPANPWGLLDMHGNVWEWCADSYGPYTAAAEIVDPRQDPADPGGADRVIRGGCYWSEAWGCRSAFRFWRTAGDRYDNQGFRVLLPSPPSSPL
jgi:formylglycine-generating enzyme required for sulfatase activity